MTFVLSAGPLYHYAAMPIVWIAGLTFLGIKLASVVVSLFVLLTISLLGNELLNRELGLLAATVAGVSSWLLIFSRLGNSQIIIPLLSTLACLLAARVARHGRDGDVVGCALVSALGWYTYPQTFVLPGVMFVVLVCLVLTRMEARWRHVGIFVLVSLPCVIPFGLIVARDPANFFSGYIGGQAGCRQSSGERSCGATSNTRCLHCTCAAMQSSVATRPVCLILTLSVGSFS